MRRCTLDHAGLLDAYANAGLHWMRWDPSRSLRLAEQGAAMGSSLCLYNLSVCYAFGHGTRRDVPLAIRLEREAMLRGENEGRVALAWRYLNGVGVRLDVARAIRMYKVAAKRGSASAFYSVGQYYFDDDRLKLAERWLLGGAALGHGNSRYYLALIAHRRGDRAATKRWFKQALSVDSIIALEDGLPGG